MIGTRDPYYGLLPNLARTYDFRDDDDLFPRKPRVEVPLTAFGVEA